MGMITKNLPKPTFFQNDDDDGGDDDDDEDADDNHHRFSTLENCVASCGGGRPQERAECHQVDRSSLSLGVVHILRNHG